MNEHEQQPEFPDELLSAYLDGELSPAEKLRVEEQLMDSAEHRRLFEELKSLRRSLQSLPTESLGEDFAQRVLRRAERELLAEGSAMATSTHSEPDAAAAAPSLSPGRQFDRGARRGLWWSIAATAAAVGLIVVGPLLNENTRTITQRDPAARPTESPETQAAQRADSAPAAGASPQSVAESEAAGFAAPSEPFPSQATSDASANEEALKADARDDATSVAQPNDKQAQAVPPAQPVAHESRNLRGAMRDDVAASTRPSAAAPATDKANAAKLLQSAAEKTAADRPTGDGRKLGKPSDADNALRLSDFGGGGAPAGAVQGAMKARRGERRKSSASPATALVTLDVTPAAFSAKFFDQLLARHEIAVENASAGTLPANRAFGPEELGEARGIARKQAAEVLDDELLDEDVDVLYVVASQSQIDGLLRDLRAGSVDVLAMAYDDGDGEAQKESAATYRFAERARQAHDLADGAFKTQLDKLAIGEEQQDDATANQAQPQATASTAAEIANAAAPSDVKADDDRHALDEQLSSAGNPGFARRLSLPAREMAEFEQRLQKADAVRGGPAPARAEGGNRIAAPSAATGGSAPLSIAAEGANAPAAPQSNVFAAEAPHSDVPSNDRGELAKAKQQNLVRVLFVLRAVAPAKPAARPADSNEAPASDAKKEASP